MLFRSSKTEETNSKTEETSSKTEETSSKTEETSSKTEETSSKTEESTTSSTNKNSSQSNNTTCEADNCTCKNSEDECKAVSKCEWSKVSKGCSIKKNKENAALSVSFRFGKPMRFMSLWDILFRNLPMLKYHGMIFINNIRRFRVLQDEITYDENYTIEANSDINTYVLESGAENGTMNIGGMLAGTDITRIAVKQEPKGAGISVSMTELASNCPSLTEVIIDETMNVADATGLVEGSDNAIVTGPSSVVDGDIYGANSTIICKEGQIKKLSSDQYPIENGYISQQGCSNNAWYNSSVTCDIGYESNDLTCDKIEDKKTYKAAFVVFLVLFILVFIASSVLAFFLLQGKPSGYNNARNYTEEKQ